jgi:hypothetical protein
VKLTAETRTTIWQKLNPTYNTAAETTSAMMQLQIDHGKTVTNGTYVYLVSATGTVPALLPQIISNTTSIQAVAAADSSVIGAVFYDNLKGFTYGKYTYSFSSPVALLMENYNSDSITVTVTDATMNSTLLKTTLTTTLPISGTNVTKSGNNYVLTINLPQGELCGSPATVKVKRIKDATGLNALFDTDLSIKIIGRTVCFPSEIKQLSVFNSLGVNVVNAHHISSCVLPVSGVYMLQINGKVRKVIVGKN